MLITSFNFTYNNFHSIDVDTNCQSVLIPMYYKCKYLTLSFTTALMKLLFKLINSYSWKEMKLCVMKYNL